MKKILSMSPIGEMTEYRSLQEKGSLFSNLEILEAGMENLITLVALL